jgi:hypothetical protein
MESFIEILRIFIPSIVVIGLCFFIVRSFLQYEQKKGQLKAQSSKMELVIPARMQAYERIILLLERITPENLIRRTLKVTLSGRMYQSELIAAVRSEYDHNVSQQVYMSPAAWAMVKTATEETIRLVNVSGSKLPSSAMAADLAENILRITAQIGKFPTHIAIDSIKKEFSQYFLEQTDMPHEEKQGSF